VGADLVLDKQQKSKGKSFATFSFGFHLGVIITFAVFLSALQDCS